MSNEIISKGTYRGSRTEGFLNTAQYMFVLREGKRYLAIRMSNDGSVPVDAIELCVIQLSGSGKELCRHCIREEGIIWRAGEYFTPSKHPPLHEGCADIRVSIIKARSGDHTYLLRGGRVVSRYTPSKKETAGEYQGSGTTPRKRPSEKLFGWIVTFAIVAVVIINILYMLYPLLKSTNSHMDEAAAFAARNEYIRGMEEI